MKPVRSPRHFQHRGVALIVVLACLVFLTVLVLAFFVNVRTEVIASKSDADNNASRLLAETAVNVVMAQIRQATTEAGTTWASQPGMVRTFNDDGALVHGYKLFSSPDMVTTSVDPAAELAALGGWNGKPSFFTDLNEPGRNSSGTNVFPILRQPGSMDGLSVTSPPGATTNQPVPMPASWIYVLQDGTLVPPTGNSGTSATVTGATSANPIIGRIAFWTDDESSKVNVNTAGGDGVVAGNGYDDIAGKTFWDLPRFTSATETALAQYQPANNEFQRYPGHPATVSLRHILVGLGLDPNIFTSQVFYDLTPRYAYGGSRGGTVAVAARNLTPAKVPVRGDRLYSSVPEFLFSATGRNVQGGLTSDIVAQAGFFLTSHSRSPELNLYGLPRVSIWPMTDFSAGATLSATQPVPVDANHITATDQLLGFAATLPGTTTPKPYYFIRQNATAANVDIGLARNRILLSYLDRLTGNKIPGFGGKLRDKYGQNGARQILTEVFDYVRTTNTEDGGLPGNFSDGGGPRNPNWYAHDPTGLAGSGQGQVVPSNHPDWNTQGIGSFPRLAEISLLFVGMGQNYSGSSVPVPTVQYNRLGGLTSGTFIDVSGGRIPENGNRAVQAFVMMTFVNPAQSWIAGAHKFIVSIDGLQSFNLNNTSLGFVGGTTPDWKNMMIIGQPTSGDQIGQGNYLGTTPLLNMISAGGQLVGLSQTGGYHGINCFPFYSKIIPVAYDPANQTMSFNGGTLTVTVYDIKDANGTTPPNTGGGKPYPDWWLTTPAAVNANCNVVQRYTITFPGATFPIPGLTKYPIVGAPDDGARGYTPNSPDSFGRQASAGGYDRWRLVVNSNNSDRDYGRFLFDTTGIAGGAWGDVVQSMVAKDDIRTLAVRNVPASAFVAHPKYGVAGEPMAHSHFYVASTPFPGASSGSEVGKLVKDAPYNATANGVSPFDGRPVVRPGINGVTTDSGAPGDWDNGISNYPDGPWINKADEGNLPPLNPPGGFLSYFWNGANEGTATTGASYFSPNRQVPSPGMLGSLPTGIDPTGGPSKPWQTLLFRPGSSRGGLPAHPGERNKPAAGDPPDHLFMDLFWMPVAEPYAISEPFSTAGKINLNYQIMPYTYIKRSTALRAALAGEKVAVNLPSSAADKYKYKLADSTQTSAYTHYNAVTRSALDPDETLKQLEEKFDSGDIFRSATEVCDLFLIPRGESYSTFPSRWYSSSGNYALVGDNTRERPYANLYGKLTTKSNTYKVHYRVQSLQKRVNSNQATWEEGRDLVTGEKRGATIVERYLDPNVKFDDLAANAAATSLEPSYKFRILQSTSFHP